MNKLGRKTIRATSGGRLPCSCCNGLLPIESFHKQRSRSCGRRSQCIQCENLRRRKPGVQPTIIREPKVTICGRNELPSTDRSSVQVHDGFWPRVLRTVILAASEGKGVKVNIRPLYYDDKTGLKWFRTHRAVEEGIRRSFHSNPEWCDRFQISYIHMDHEVWIGARAFKGKVGLNGSNSDKVDVSMQSRDSDNWLEAVANGIHEGASHNSPLAGFDAGVTTASPVRPDSDSAIGYSD